MIRPESTIKARIDELKEQYDMLPHGHREKDALLHQIAILEWVLGGTGALRPFGKI